MNRSPKQSPIPALLETSSSLFQSSSARCCPLLEAPTPNRGIAIGRNSIWKIFPRDRQRHPYCCLYEKVRTAEGFYHGHGSLSRYFAPRLFPSALRIP